MDYFKVMLGLFSTQFIDDGVELLKVWFGGYSKLVWGLIAAVE